MNHRSGLLRRVLTPWLATLSLWASVAVPILDAEEWNHGAVVESAHDPSRCVPGHDHSICTQVVASRALPADAPRHHRDVFAQPGATLHAVAAGQPARQMHLLPLGSRAPPAV